MAWGRWWSGHAQVVHSYVLTHTIITTTLGGPSHHNGNQSYHT